MRNLSEPLAEETPPALSSSKASLLLTPVADRLRTGDNFDYYGDFDDSRAEWEPIALQGMAAGGGVALPDEQPRS
jgi:hypothetical protein